jgi:hypothetical protein
MIRKDSFGPLRPARAAIPALALVLAGCSAAPDWAKPTTWYDSVAGGSKTAEASAPPAGGAEPPPAASAEQPPPTPAAPPPAGQPADASTIPPVTSPGAPEPAKGFPNLGSVPDRPELPVTSSERANVVAGLMADRNNARYTDEELRGGTEVPAAPPRANEAAPEPAPGTTASAPAAPVAAAPAPAPAEPIAAAPAPPPPSAPAPTPPAPVASAPPPAAAAPAPVEPPPPAPAPAPAQTRTAAIPPSPPPAAPPSTSPPDFNALFAASGAAQMGAVAASVALDGDGGVDASGRRQIADLVQAHSGGRFRVVGRAADGGLAAAEAVAREMVSAGATADAVVTQGQTEAGPARADIYVEN